MIKSVLEFRFGDRKKKSLFCKSVGSEFRAIGTETGINRRGTKVMVNERGMIRSYPTSRRTIGSQRIIYIVRNKKHLHEV